MKILALFDLAHAVDPGQEFSPESLKEQDKPTEACVLECLTRLGRHGQAGIIGQQLKIASAYADVPVSSSCYCRNTPHTLRNDRLT